MSELTTDELREFDHLAGRARALYDALHALAREDFDHRLAVWSEIVAVQDQMTAILPPAEGNLILAGLFELSLTCCEKRDEVERDR
jgi:hypothetical protein